MHARTHAHTVTQPTSCPDEPLVGKTLHMVKMLGFKVPSRLLPLQREASECKCGFCMMIWSCGLLRSPPVYISCDLSAVMGTIYTVSQKSPTFLTVQLRQFWAQILSRK